jgi:hypothetical protein
LSGRLLNQLTHNNDNPNEPRNYLNFPPDHPGHLDLERQIKLVNIIKSSTIADQYRFGAAFGKMYIKKTYKHPFTSPEMVGVVIAAETTPVPN